MFLFYLTGLVSAWVVYCAISLCVNIRRARTMGVPMVIMPLSPTNHLYIILEPLICRVTESLPFSLGSKHYVLSNGFPIRITF